MVFGGETLSKPETRQRDEAWALHQGRSPGPDADFRRDVGVYEPPGLLDEDRAWWLHAFDPWAHFALRPWNPARRTSESRYFPYQIAVNALLAAIVVSGWGGGAAIRSGLLAGLGFAAFVVVSGILLVFVAGELGAPAERARYRGVAIDASSALVLTLLLLRLGFVIPAVAAIICYLIDLVAGLRAWAGFSRLRALAAVYLTLEVGMVGVGVLGLGMVWALRG